MAFKKFSFQEVADTLKIVKTKIDADDLDGAHELLDNMVASFEEPEVANGTNPWSRRVCLAPSE